MRDADPQVDEAQMRHYVGRLLMGDALHNSDVASSGVGARGSGSGAGGSGHQQGSGRSAAARAAHAVAAFLADLGVKLGEVGKPGKQSTSNARSKW